MSIKKLSVVLIGILSIPVSYAATGVNLRHQPVGAISTRSQAGAAIQSVDRQSVLQPIKTEIDFNGTKHIRMKQTYAGYPVWGADVVVHIPARAIAATKMNGTVYKHLDDDLQNTPAFVFNQAQADKVSLQAVEDYFTKLGVKQLPITAQHKKLIVYIDKNNDNKAHWAFLIDFRATLANGNTENPTYIIDAMTNEIYQYWNNIPHGDDAADDDDENDSIADDHANKPSPGDEFELVKAGGLSKALDRVYAGRPGDLPALDMVRQSSSNTCYFANEFARLVKIKNDKPTLLSFECRNLDERYNNIYWNGFLSTKLAEFNDILHFARVTSDMYVDKYQTLVLTDKDGKLATVNFIMHYSYARDNAAFDMISNNVYVGASDLGFPSMSELGTIAHELSHGFTYQHSGLIYKGQAGGLNESFSDMASQAAEYYSAKRYATVRNDWKLSKYPNGKAVRYMDDPRRDCEDPITGELKDKYSCSIDNAKNYSDKLDVHHTSGVFNKAFYLLSVSSGWNVDKAFKVMVKANKEYWLADTTFDEAACGVVDAAKDYAYDLETVVNVMKQVGIDAERC